MKATAEVLTKVVKLSFLLTLPQTGRALPRASRGMLLGEVARESRVTPWWTGVSGALVLNRFLSNTAKCLRKPNAAPCISQPQEGRSPQHCFSGQVDLYLGIFILDCKAQSILCTVPPVISLELLFTPGSLYKCVLQETKYE